MPKFTPSFVLEAKFPDEKSAFDQLKAEEIWHVDPHRGHPVKGGCKIHYRCNKANITGSPCSVLKCLYFPKDSEEVWMYQTNNKHNHDKTSLAINNIYHRAQLSNGAIRKKFRCPMEKLMKMRIFKLAVSLKSPKEILLQLESEGFEVKHREFQIRNYCSKTRRKINPIKWRLEKTFTTVDEAKLYLKRQKIWNYKFHNDSQSRIIYHYRCKFVPRVGPQCAARKYFRLNKHTNDVTLYRTDCPHTHANIIRLEQLLKNLRKCDRGVLKNKEFRVLKSVSLKDCLLDRDNYNMQQQSQSSFDYQIKEEAITDYEDFENYEILNIGNRIYRKFPFTPNWIFEEKFDNEEMALERLGKDGVWHIDSRRVYKVTGGRKVHYRCNRVKIEGPQCAAGKCLLYSDDSDEVLVYTKDHKHTHDTIAHNYRKSKASKKWRIMRANRTIVKNGGVPVKRKRGRPLKHGRDSTVNLESIITQVGLDSKPHFNNDSEGISTELVPVKRKRGRPLKHGRNSLESIMTQVGLGSKPHFSNDSEGISTELVPVKRKRGRPLKHGRNSTVNLESIMTQVGLGSKPHFSNDSQGISTELVTEDESTQYVINYMDDDINYGKDIICDKDTIRQPELEAEANNQIFSPMDTVVCNKKILWTFEDKIPSKDMVPTYLNKQNTWRCKYRRGKSSKVNYICNRNECEAQMFLSYEKEHNDVLVYRSGKHSHEITYKTDDLPLHFQDTELIPDSYPNSNIIVKEELIIADNEPMEITQPENNAISAEAYYNDDDEQKMVPKIWSFENKFINIDEANNFLIASKGQWQSISGTPERPFYRCTYPCEPNCPARLCFLIKKNCDEVFCFSGDEPHSHPVESKIDPSLSLTEEIIISDSDTEAPKPLTNPNNIEIHAKDVPEIPVLKEFTFKEKFANVLEARNEMRQNWVSTCTRRFKNESRQYFWCSYNTDHRICASRALLLRRNDSDEILYYTSSSHTHNTNLSEKETTEIENPAETSNCNDEIISSKTDDSDKNLSIGEGEEFDDTQKHWAFETKFDDYKTAKLYMTNLNLLSFKSKITKQGVKEYFMCNLLFGSFVHCATSKYLFYEDINSDILMFSRNIRHAEKCKNIIPTLVPTFKQPTHAIDLVGSDTDDESSDNDRNTITDNKSDSNEITSSQQNISLHNKKWTLEKEFGTFEEAIEYLKDQQIWTKISPSKVPGNDFYRCNLTIDSSEHRNTRCAATKYLQISNETGVVSIHKSEQGHTHDPLSSAARAAQVFESLDNASKAKIKELVLAGNTPREVYAQLELLDFEFPLKKHLLFSIAKMRRNNFLKTANPPEKVTTAMSSIEDWLSVISAIPKNDDAQFCVDFTINHSNQTFQCFLSTRRLLKNAVDACLVNLDSTCLLNWVQNPITIVGTTDLGHQFHFFGIAICSNKNEYDYEFMFKAIQKGVEECHNKTFKPECLIADENEAVRNAFIKTFGISSKIGMCSRVALSKIMHKLSTCLVVDSLKLLIKEDILKIQKLSTQSLFFKAVDLFFRKWRPQAESQLDAFLNYFKTYWINRNPNWFQGFRPSTPHTNKALRAEYNTLTKYLSSKQNLPIHTFRYQIHSAVERLSLCYANGEIKRFIDKPIIPMTVYEKAVEWNNLGKQIEIVHRSPATFYYISTGDEKSICAGKLQKYRKCEHQSLDEFFEIQFGFYCLRRLSNSDRLTCTCSDFLDKFVCEHSVGMASALNLIKMPPNIEKLLLNKKQNNVKM